MKMTANDIAEARRSISNKLVQDCVPFTAICPKCQQHVSQHGYSRIALFSFLDMVHPIDAYCASCDEVWPIDAQERHALAETLSAPD